MYEVGKKRPDGKYNVWRRICIDNYWWEWVVAIVCDSFTEASDYANSKNRKKQRVKENA